MWLNPNENKFKRKKNEDNEVYFDLIEVVRILSGV